MDRCRAYYFGASYTINKENRLEIYAIGAPQRHGQNSYKQNIAAYDSNYAKSIFGFDVRAIKKFPQSPEGRFYNENWNNVNPSYTGQQFWNGTTHSRREANFINEKENYYSKPLVNLNWDPFTRIDPNDKGQVWKTPAYTIFDFHFRYKLPINLYGIILIYSLTCLICLTQLIFKMQLMTVSTMLITPLAAKLTQHRMQKYFLACREHSTLGLHSPIKCINKASFFGRLFLTALLLL